MEGIRLFIDGKFTGELFCVECYSEDDKNWGVVVFEIDEHCQPLIIPTRKVAQELMKKVKIIMQGAEFCKYKKLRISRYLRG